MKTLSSLLKILFITILILSSSGSSFAGCYSPEEEKVLATKIRDLQNNVKIMQLEVDKNKALVVMFKTAYEKEQNINSDFSNLYKEYKDRAEEKVVLLEKKIELQLKEINNLKTSNKSLKLKAATYKTFTEILAIALIIVVL